VEPLNQHEVRVLGCLIEKQRTVPDSYPLTLNALLSACNQTSNRDPVLSMEPFEVEAALAGLRSHGLTRVVHSQSQRAEKFRHVVGEALGLEDDAITVLAPMLLRGPQTANELRPRTERYVPGVLYVEDALHLLASREDPLVVNIGKRSGQREERWMHLLGGPVDPDEFSAPTQSKEVTSPTVERLAALEERVARLEAQLEELLG
jgi:uncharacterized protein YceH (UPF0502 family)